MQGLQKWKWQNPETNMKYFQDKMLSHNSFTHTSFSETEFMNLKLLKQEMYMNLHVVMLRYKKYEGNSKSKVPYFLF
jgi:hypothetical protein